jgi:hypothetical protein
VDVGREVKIQNTGTQLKLDKPKEEIIDNRKPEQILL